MFIFSHFCQLLLILFLTNISPPPKCCFRSGFNLLWSPYYCKKLPHKYTCSMKIVIFFIVFSQQANGGPTAHYTTAASSNTATRVSHCNKLLFINSLFLIIFNNLYILHCKVQILAFQQESVYLYTGE